jgi:hypothetical protein
MTRRRIDLDEEGWIRVGCTTVAVIALAVMAGFLGASPALIALGVAVLAGAPAVWLWHLHFTVDGILADRDKTPTDVPHHADEPHRFGTPVDRAN